MAFTEKVHAYLAAKYYIYLTETFGERGKRAFLHATQYYALQRGRRMAQRAIRDGEELTQAAYNYYGEWVSTEEVKAEGCANKMDPQPDGSLRVTVCPWYTQFHEMGLTEGGALYCKDLDSSISRGFNPFLNYQVDQTLHTADCCIHRLLTGDICSGSKRGKNPDSLKGFDYHCAHLYWSFAEVTGSIFSEEGKTVSDRVLSDFEQDYGKEMTETLLMFQNTNFNII